MSPDTSKPWWRLPSRLVFIGFLAVAAFFLITEHRAHALGVLPFVLLLACPLMHFLHGGHAGHGGHGGPRDDGEAPQRREKTRHQH